MPSWKEPLQNRWNAFSRTPFGCLLRLFAGRMFHGGDETGAEELGLGVGAILTLLAMPGLLEEEKKQINRPVPELPLSEDTEMLDVSPKNGNGAKMKVSTRTVTTLTESVAHFQQDAPTCPSCGHVAVRNGACYKCLNCGESLGCS